MCVNIIIILYTIGGKVVKYILYFAIANIPYKSSLIHPFQKSTRLSPCLCEIKEVVVKSESVVVFCLPILRTHALTFLYFFSPSVYKSGSEEKK